MTETHPVDLIYGHLGDVTYDTESHEWQFARKPGVSRQLKPVGAPLVAIEASLTDPIGGRQNAVERSQNIKDLIHEYPDLSSSAFILPELAQTSEVVNEITSSHDPLVSELLAFGKAINPRSNTHTEPIVAIAGGASGEAVRLVLLTREELGWKDGKTFKLNTQTAKGCLEGWWSGNAGPVQQLCFAETKGQANAWLAVRYQCAISILQPRLLSSNPDSAHGVLTPYPLSPLDAHHIVTLPVQCANSVPFANVSFNPWNPLQFATIDQKGDWSVWNLAKEGGSWSIKGEQARTGSTLGGHDDDPSSSPAGTDGWGAVLWVGDYHKIFVASRTELSLFDIESGPQPLPVPDIVGKAPTDWILDMKRNPLNPSHVWVVTSSTLSCLWVDGEQDSDMGGSKPGAKCLLSWRHFRAQEDSSLRLNVVDLAATDLEKDNIGTTSVMVYSRFNSLTTAFTFQYYRSFPGRVISTSDPYIVPLTECGAKVAMSTPKYDRLYRVSTIILTPVGHKPLDDDTTTGPGPRYRDENVEFYQLSILFNDLKLSEYLYAGAMAGVRLSIPSPATIKRFKVPKTFAEVTDAFIVPNGYMDQEEDETSPTLASQHLLPNCARYDNRRRRRRASERDNSVFAGILSDNQVTINFEWLRKDVNCYLSEESGSKSFNENLKLINTAAEDKFTSRRLSIETLLLLGNEKVSVKDVDEASNSLSQALQSIDRFTSDIMDVDEAGTESRLAVSRLLTPVMRTDLGVTNNTQLSEIYECLVKDFITFLPQGIPSRIRISLERVLRDISGQICLASHGIRVEPVSHNSSQPSHEEGPVANTSYSLPVRKRTSTAILAKSKEKAIETLSSPPTSSQISNDVGFMTSSPHRALPTPEPTPSLHSQSSASSLTVPEDPAVQRLRALANIEFQPLLPSKLQNNILDHWQAGDDPWKYDWEGIQRSLTDGGAKKGGRAKQRLKRRRNEPVVLSSQPMLRQFGGSQTEQMQEIWDGSQRTDTVGPSLQPLPTRLGGVHPRQMQETQGSSQQTEGMGTRSQTEPGPYGSRRSAFKISSKKPRKGGF